MIRYDLEKPFIDGHFLLSENGGKTAPFIPVNIDGDESVVTSTKNSTKDRPEITKKSANIWPEYSRFSLTFRLHIQIHLLRNSLLSGKIAHKLAFNYSTIFLTFLLYYMTIF